MRKTTVYNEIHRAIPECRISMEACEEIASHLRAECEEIAKQAYVFAQHGKRITVNVEDVRLAIRERIKK